MVRLPDLGRNSAPPPTPSPRSSGERKKNGGGAKLRPLILNAVLICQNNHNLRRIMIKVEIATRRLRHNKLVRHPASEHALSHGRTRSRAGFNSRRSVQGEG